MMLPLEVVQRPELPLLPNVILAALALGTLIWLVVDTLRRRGER